MRSGIEHNASLPMPVQQAALRHQVSRRLMYDVFRGAIPAGTKLVVQKLALGLGVSATPVREALLDLEAMGIVRFEHHRGAVVNPFGPQALRDIYHLRGILEAEAARCATGRIERCILDTLRQEIIDLLNTERNTEDEHWSRREIATDRRLHGLITAAGENRRLAIEIRRYDTLVQTVRDILGQQYEAQKQAAAEHVRILDALLANDPERAGSAMAGHISSAAEYAVATLFSENTGRAATEAPAGPQASPKETEHATA